LKYLSPKIRKFAFFGLNAFVVLASWSFVIQPFFSSVGEAIEKMHDTEFDLQRERQALMAQRGISTGAVVQAELEAFKYLQTGDTLAAATVNMQSNISKIAKESGMALESMTAESANAKSDLLEPLTVNVKLKGPESAFAKFLQAVETQSQPLHVKTLVARSQESGRAPNGAPIMSIDTELKITGFWAERKTK
jgi:hypothetical protein